VELFPEQSQEMMLEPFQTGPENSATGKKKIWKNYSGQQDPVSRTIFPDPEKQTL
jgi:hypothetical protein